MHKFEKLVIQLINKSDVVLMILDARFVDLTYSEKWANYVKRKNKPLILVINKVDMISLDEEKKLEEYVMQKFDEPFVMFSAKKRWGGKILKMKIYEIMDAYDVDDINVGLIGYPNMGKSSIISILKGKTSAKISSSAGFTRGLQKVRINKKLSLWDAPGIDLETHDKTLLALLGSINPEKLKDVITPAEIILKKYDCSIEQYALKLNMLAKFGEPDLNRAAKDVLRRYFKNDLTRMINKIRNLN